jgi:hypothetical protein
MRSCAGSSESSGDIARVHCGVLFGGQGVWLLRSAEAWVAGVWNGGLGAALMIPT